MNDELIDILNKEGKPTGQTAFKSEIHSKGYYHNTAHVWFYNSDGKILLAQRASTKTLHPLLWDVSVAGHIDAGESVERGAIREIKEEIGLTISENDLQKIGIFLCFQSYENGIVDNEFHHTYIIELKVGIHYLIPQEGEVENLKLMSFQEFSNIIDHIGMNHHLVSSNKPYYQFVLKAIRQKFN